MTKQESLKKLKEQVKKLEQEIRNTPINQTVPEQRLEWGRIAETLMDWKEAKKWCKRQGKGWRLPTVIELLQAFEDENNDFGMDSYWSSIEDSGMNARNVYFTDGSTYYHDKTFRGSVRCVRER